MKRDYRVEHIFTKEQMEEFKRRQILNRRIRCACKVVGVIAFIFALGTCGGLDNGTITIREFIANFMTEIALMVASFIIYNLAE